MVGEVLGGAREEWSEGRGIMVGKGCRGGEERGRVRVDRVESRNMLMGERGEF